MFYTNPPKDKQCQEWASRLREVLAKSKRVMYHGPTWTAAFAGLKKKYGSDRVEKVLSWFLRNVGGEFVPRLASATSFRDKFTQVEDAMSRSDDVPSEDIPQRDRDLAKSLLDDYCFPVEVSARLPLLVKRTREAWDKFCESLVGCDKYMKEHPRWWDFVNRVLEFQAPVFVENWFVYLSRRLGRQKTYPGPVLSLAFRAASEWFKNSFWRSWSFEWCGDATAFDELLAELVKEAGSACNGGRS